MPETIRFAFQKASHTLQCSHSQPLRLSQGFREPDGPGGGVDRGILQGMHLIGSGFNIGVLTVSTSRSSPWTAGATSHVCVTSRPQSSPRHRAPAFSESVKLPRGVRVLPSRGPGLPDSVPASSPPRAFALLFLPHASSAASTSSSSLHTLSLPLPDQDAQA